jgi:hypothetical protein
MRFRKLRIAWSVVWGIAAVLLVVLWVRSYWWADYVQPWQKHTVVSLRGKLFVDNHIVLSIPSSSVPGGVPTGLVETNRFFAYSLATKQFSFFPQKSGLAIPYWLIAALIVGLAATPWLRWRFSLRTLLIATTLLAAALAVWVYIHL